MDNGLVGLPLWIQILITIGVLIGGVLVGMKGLAGKFFGGEKEENRHAILEYGSITDMAPVREMVSYLKRIADASEKSVGSQDRSTQATIELISFLKNRFDAEQRSREVAEATAKGVAQALKNADDERRRERRQRDHSTDST